MKRILYQPYKLLTNIEQTMCGTTYYYNEVKSARTNKIWLDRNLGATDIPLTYSGHTGYGALFQWGRLIDGHQCIDWTENAPLYGTTSTLSTTNTPGNNLFIITNDSGTYYDWRNPQNDNLWQFTDPMSSVLNDICPRGYRIPTEAEIEDERLGWHSNNLTGAFDSELKITANGYRDYVTGNLSSYNTVGAYWSMTTSGTNVISAYITTGNAILSPSQRAYGMAIRCIKINQPYV